MNRVERWQARRAQRAALRQRLAESRRQGRERLSRISAVQRAQRRRRVRRAALLVAFAVLLLLLRCDCEPPPAPPVVEQPALPVENAPPVAEKPKPKPKPPRFAGKVTKKPRPPFEGELPPAPRWLDELRLQVAARSTRLATCFNDSGRPGALLFGAAVNAELGSIADPTLEPIAGSASLTEQQRACVLEVLSSPRYRLGGLAGAVPERVSLLIEF